MWSQLKENIIDIFLPKRCAGCGEEGKYICDECRLFISESSLICPVCQRANFDGQSHSYCSGKKELDGLISVWDYEGIIKRLLLKIKYESMFDAINELVEKAFEIREPYIPKDTAICFVPMFRRKERQRGFNQAELIARKVGQTTGREVLPLLEKIKDTVSQTELNKEERIANVKDSFRMIKGPIPYDNVLLVDDVWTSGATMGECCRVLKNSGIKKAWGFTLARTV